MQLAGSATAAGLQFPRVEPTLLSVAFGFDFGCDFDFDFLYPKNAEGAASLCVFCARVGSTEACGELFLILTLILTLILRPYPTAYGYLSRRSPKTFTSSAPETNPPTCAQNATPPIFCLCTERAVAVPLRKFNTNQYPKIVQAGTHTTNTKNHVSTRALG